MTSRTIDIHCEHCRKYLFSLWPDDTEGLKKDYYCRHSPCKEAATVAKLNGTGRQVEIVKE